MKLAVLTPLPPVKSGIAHYSALLLGELARRHEVTAVVDQETVGPVACPWIRFEEFETRYSSFDAVICQLGNNLHHEFVWSWARRSPSVIVLHEIVLHHLLVECTLARGDGDALEEALGAEYGEAGVRVAEAREADLHGEVANFLMPASSLLAEGSKHVIVHNQWASTRLREAGVTTPITVVPHPYERPPVFTLDDIARVRRDSGWSDAGAIIGAFGFVTRAKRPEVVMESFGIAVRQDPRLRLVFVGEAAPNVDLPALAAEAGVPDGSWRATGYVTDEAFDLWMNVVDRVVSLRYPTAGESSGPIVRAFAVGRPVAVNDYAQFSELAESLVSRIPFDRETDALSAFMTDRSIDVAAFGSAQRAWLEANATVVHTADGYESALRSRAGRAVAARVPEGIPLHPAIEVRLEELHSDGGANIAALRLTNGGPSTIPCAAWGSPHYLLRARIFTKSGSEREVTCALSRDLAPGESTTVELESGDEGISRIELCHALSGIPHGDGKPFAVLEPKT
jgi:glycosyltransferase involved in cell wall biosynthesis